MIVLNIGTFLITIGVSALAGFGFGAWIVSKKK